MGRDLSVKRRWSTVVERTQHSGANSLCCQAKDLPKATASPTRSAARFFSSHDKPPALAKLRPPMPYVATSHVLCSHRTWPARTPSGSWASWSSCSRVNAKNTRVQGWWRGSVAGQQDYPKQPEVLQPKAQAKAMSDGSDDQLRSDVSTLHARHDAAAYFL